MTMEQKTYNRTILILITLVSSILLSSCSVFKNNKKSKDIEKVEEVKVVEQKEVSKTDVKVNQTDKQNDINTSTTETTTKETIKSPDIKVSVPRADIILGKPITLLDASTGKKIIVLLDSLANSLDIKVEGDTIVRETKVKTTTTSDKSKESSKDVTDNSQKQVAINQRDEKDGYKKSVDAESDTSIVGIIGLFVGLVILIVGVIWGLKKFLFSNLLVNFSPLLSFLR